VKRKLKLEVEFDDASRAEDIAEDLGQLLKTALSTPGVFERPVSVGSFEVVPQLATLVLVNGLEHISGACLVPISLAADEKTRREAGDLAEYYCQRLLDLTVDDVCSTPDELFSWIREMNQDEQGIEAAVVEDKTKRYATHCFECRHDLTKPDGVEIEYVTVESQFMHTPARLSEDGYLIRPVEVDKSVEIAAVSCPACGAELSVENTCPEEAEPSSTTPPAE
jgi:hypothetical protein